MPINGRGRSECIAAENAYTEEKAIRPAYMGPYSFIVA